MSTVTSVPGYTVGQPAAIPLGGPSAANVVPANNIPTQTTYQSGAAPPLGTGIAPLNPVHVNVTNPDIITTTTTTTPGPIVQSLPVVIGAPIGSGFVTQAAGSQIADTHQHVHIHREKETITQIQGTRSKKEGKKARKEAKKQEKEAAKEAKKEEKEAAKHEERDINHDNNDKSLLEKHSAEHATESPILHHHKDLVAPVTTGTIAGLSTIDPNTKHSKINKDNLAEDRDTTLYNQETDPKIKDKDVHTKDKLLVPSEIAASSAGAHHVAKEEHKSKTTDKDGKHKEEHKSKTTDKDGKHHSEEHHSEDGKEDLSLMDKVSRKLGGIAAIVADKVGPETSHQFHEGREEARKNKKEKSGSDSDSDSHHKDSEHHDKDRSKAGTYDPKEEADHKKDTKSDDHSKSSKSDDHSKSSKSDDHSKSSDSKPEHKKVGDLMPNPSQ